MWDSDGGIGDSLGFFEFPQRRSCTLLIAFYMLTFFASNRVVHLDFVFSPSLSFLSFPSLGVVVAAHGSGCVFPDITIVFDVLWPP